MNSIVSKFEINNHFIFLIKWINTSEISVLYSCRLVSSPIKAVSELKSMQSVPLKHTIPLFTNITAFSTNRILVI